MMQLDGTDIGILVALWEQGHRSIELEGNTADNRKRLYRMSRAGLCGCSRGNDCPAPDESNDFIWGITDTGQEVVNLAEADYAGAWREKGWSLEYKQQKPPTANTAWRGINGPVSDMEELNDL